AVAAGRVFDILDEPSSPSPPAAVPSSPKIRRGVIEFDKVSFSYDGKTLALDHISFTVQPGQTVALVGPTGSGKSSIANLLLRFYPPTHGSIRIDQTPLDEFSEEDLRSATGLVLQDPFIFYGDITENIRLGDNTLTDRDVQDAAAFVQADAFIRQLEGAYHTLLSEGGATLSLGQRQLLAFARTISRHPKILVLDEATANIDTETEQAIYTALQKMRKDRTTIAIAHRLSTIQDADLILVLQQGRIVERGTHRQLLEQRGLYYTLYRLQQGAAAKPLRS
ncbi:MAG: ATP-binding cassette domain-containing protein, partial [Firmicutes bacterium]|nr:ATP-binding cassette domain-containing protein [Bacillota bacterium]